jgi:hypothetical protein
MTDLKQFDEEEADRSQVTLPRKKHWLKHRKRPSGLAGKGSNENDQKSDEEVDAEES